MSKYKVKHIKRSGIWVEGKHVKDCSTQQSSGWFSDRNPWVLAEHDWPNNGWTGCYFFTCNTTSCSAKLFVKDDFIDDYAEGLLLGNILPYERLAEQSERKLAPQATPETSVNKEKE